MKQNRDRITKAKAQKTWDCGRPMNTNRNKTKLGQALIKNSFRKTQNYE